MASDDGEQSPQDFECPRNFYCHQCHSRTGVGSEDFSCSSCGSGFIEEVSEREYTDGDNGADEQEGIPFFGENPILEQLFAHAIHPSSQGGTASVEPRRRDPHNRVSPDAVAHAMFGGDQFFQSLISNLTGVPIGHRFQFAVGPGGSLFGGPGSNVMYGNPGDYVWGRGGFDAIVTQLLNQMEGTGPPPMTKDSINRVPEVKVNQQHIDQNLQCSVCWEDFKLEETVRQLNCDHIFHPDCILPWLELHATCPVCREPLTEDAKAAQEADDREYNGHDDHEGAAGASSNRPSGYHLNNPSFSTGSSSQGGGSGRPSRGSEPTSGPNRGREADIGATISLVFNQLFGQPGGQSEDTSRDSNSARPSSSSAVSSHNSPDNSSSDQGKGQGRQEFHDFDPE